MKLGEDQCLGSNTVAGGLRNLCAGEGDMIRKNLK